jgi:fucose permease
LSTSSSPASSPERATGARPTFVFSAFFVMGIFDGTLGVAWPSMRVELHQPLAALGLLLIYSTCGFLLVNLLLNPVLDRLGVRGALALGSGLFGLALLLVGLGQWPVVVLGAVIWGLASGLVNAAINVYSTVRMSGSAMQVLHGLWGVGTLLGPLLVTASLLSGHGWRPPVVVTACGELALLGWALAGPAWPDPRRGRAGAPPFRVSAPLLLGLAAFFLYTAAEWTGGQWSFTVLTESRGFTTATAGLIVSLYWTGLTAGRLLSGVAGLRFTTERLLAAGVALAMAAAAGFWLLPGWSAVELPMLGLGLAPIYPALMKLTLQRVPEATVGAAVGLQTASGGLGAAFAPAGVGLAMQRFGLPLFGPLVLLLTVLTAAAGLIAQLPGPWSREVAR